MISEAQKKIRVLIVDDSAVVRKMVSDALSTDAGIEVVGTAIDPYIAKEKILALEPDVLTLDLEMPRMDGLSFLKIIMERRPMPVIILSSLTTSGSPKAAEAIRLGAVEVLAKPNGSSFSIGDMGIALPAKIRSAAAHCARLSEVRNKINAAKPRVAPAPNAQTPQAACTLTEHEQTALGIAAHPHEPSPIRPLAVPAVAKRVVRVATHGGASAHAHTRKLILIGASTGGTEAVREVLQRLPGDLPGIAIVQHIPPVFSRTFAERLNELCAMEVREAVDGDVLHPGLALVAPGGFHMLIERAGSQYRVRVVAGPMVWHQRPAVDVLFKSAVESVGSHAVATILTGMGKDGAEGLLRLREKGAQTFAQSEESCVVYGMPRAANEIGAAMKMVALDRMHEAILQGLAATAD